VTIKKLLSTTLLFLLTIFNSLPSSASSNDVLIYIRDDIYADYLEFIGDRDVLTIKDFSTKTIRRDVLDMVIAQQALKLGGFNYSFSYASGKVIFRNTKMLQSGELLISFDSYWQQDAQAISDSVYISDAVIRDGEYIVGIYTSPNNLKTLAIKNLSDLTDLTSISTPRWRTDWQTLTGLPLKELMQENSWLSMARMVNIQWVDFILMPFTSTQDKSFILENIHLVPVQNIGVLLQGSRHYVISKAHSKGEQAFIAINKGLKILRKKGEIIRAYKQAKFFIDPDKYTVLNPQ
jgi:hypothetical protein